MAFPGFATSQICSEFFNISNEGGPVKSVLLLFLFLAHTPYLCAVPLFPLASDAPQFSGGSLGPTYWLGSCHFIDSVWPTKHLSDHSRP
jgi:hypothetical protein